MTHREELIWAAGLFEGEGYISPTKKRGMRIGLGMTDRDVVESFMRIVECGIISVEPRRPPRKEVFRWRANGDDAAGVLLALAPYLHQRRLAKAEAVLARRTMDERVCPQCSTVFRPNALGSHGQRYCSKQCKGRAGKFRERHAVSQWQSSLRWPS